jgi:hypothetical protein
MAMPANIGRLDQFEEGKSLGGDGGEVEIIPHTAAAPTMTSKSRTRARSRHGFEPVSAKIKPVSGGSLTQIPDIEHSAGRDTSRGSGAFRMRVPTFSPETRLLNAKLRKCRLFLECRALPARDRVGWLCSQDSNLGMAEFKLPSRVCERGLSNDGAISVVNARISAQIGLPRLSKKSHKVTKYGRSPMTGKRGFAAPLAVRLSTGSH